MGWKKNKKRRKKMSSKQKKLYTPFVLNPRHGKAYNKTKYTILKTKAIFFIRPEISHSRSFLVLTLGRRAGRFLLDSELLGPWYTWCRLMIYSLDYMFTPKRSTCEQSEGCVLTLSDLVEPNGTERGWSWPFFPFQGKKNVFGSIQHIGPRQQNQYER